MNRSATCLREKPIALSKDGGKKRIAVLLPDALLIRSTEKRHPEAEGEFGDEATGTGMRFLDHLAKRLGKLSELCRFQEITLIEPHLCPILVEERGMNAVSERELNRVECGHRGLREIDVPKVIGHHVEVTAVVGSVSFQPDLGKRHVQIGDELCDHKIPP